MNKGSVARRYATALFNLLDGSSVPVVRESLAAISSALSDSQPFKHVLASPVFTFEEKRAVVNELCDRAGAPAVLKQFCEQVLRKSRGSVLPEIASAFSDLADEQKGIQPVWIASATSLSSDEQRNIESQLASQLGRPVKASFDVEPDLIAGVRIHIGSRVFDSTVKGKLANMRTRVVKG